MKWSIFVLTFVAFTTQTGFSQTILPFVGADQIVVPTGNAEKHLAGRIEDISGEVLTFRREDSGKIEVHRLTDLPAISFSRPPDWASGMTRYEGQEYRRAFENFAKAIRAEPRSWARVELQGLAAAFSIQAGRFDEAVDLLEQSFQIDKRTRHVSLLPLVWAEDLAESEKVTFRESDLTSPSLVRSLIAASAGLENSKTRTRCTAVLEDIRKSSGIVRLSQLAEAQLWRLDLIASDDATRGLIYRADAVNFFPAESRGGPAFVLGRMLARAHRYDEAALSFLWQPTMHPRDRGLAALALGESARMCEQSGRPREAISLRNELRRRFPDSSVAKQLRVESNEPVD